MPQEMGPFCQSCGMPMQSTEDYGTRADGSQSGDYCHFCYQNGAFTEPGLTLDQMIDRTADVMARMMDVTQDEALQTATDFMPKLKRWRKSAA